VTYKHKHITFLARNALTPGGTDHVSDICLLWPSTLTYDLGPWTWRKQSQDKPLVQTCRSKIISFETYCPDT